MPSTLTLNEKMSDIVGETTIRLSDNAKIKNNFNLDQNLEKFNRNQIALDLVYPKTNFNISFLEENQYIGNKKFVGRQMQDLIFNNGLISFGAKRNLLTNSAEFYDLSYEYINDCLRAGVAFRANFIEIGL